MTTNLETQAVSTAVITGICYQAHVQNIGWQGTVCNGQTAGTTGQNLRIEAIKIFLQGAPAGVGICYQAHVQNIGWQSTVCNGQEAGTTGQNLRIEAIKIWLTNPPSGAKVSYRAHVQNIGWQGWVSDQGIAGTVGQGLRIEALEIKIESGSSNVYGESPYIFGIHEAGGEQIMADKGKKGWIVFTEALGRDRNNTSGKDFRPWADAGYGVIVRLNHGYGNDGTLPYQKHYDDFAQRVANYVNSSPGAHIWVIANECNLSVEWPRYEGGAEPITAEKYADCFRRVRSKIKALPGHSGDQVVMQGVGPWNTQIGQGWIEYYVDILNRLGAGGVDGIALHTYTHGTEPALISSEQKMNPPYNNRYYHFRTYKDFMNANPSWARSLPVYITETDQDVAWANTNSGWVKNAYAEINSWNQNSANQKIRALVLYRWASEDAKYNLATRPEVLNDFRDALNNNYRWT